jgi:hypothetical protein
LEIDMAREKIIDERPVLILGPEKRAVHADELDVACTVWQQGCQAIADLVLVLVAVLIAAWIIF